MSAPAALTLYGIPNCDTVKKARAWLAERGVEVRFHDFKKQRACPKRRWTSGSPRSAGKRC